MSRNPDRRAREPEIRERLRARLGEACREARNELGLTQEAVATACGLSTEHYAKIERGERQPPLLTLAALREVLGIDLNAVFEPAERHADRPPAPHRASTFVEYPRPVQKLITLGLQASPGTLKLVCGVMVEIARHRRPKRARSRARAGRR